MYAKLFNCATPEKNFPRSDEALLAMWRMRIKRTNLNVSHAAINTLKPFCMSQKQTFDRLVLFPTPFTPTNVILYGTRCWVDVRGEESLLRIDSNKSVDVFGVSIRVMEVESACRTAALVAAVPEFKQLIPCYDYTSTYFESHQSSCRLSFLRRPRTLFLKSPLRHSSS
jgi:hypothetical protein